MYNWEAGLNYFVLVIPIGILYFALLYFFERFDLYAKKNIKKPKDRLKVKNRIIWVLLGFVYLIIAYLIYSAVKVING